MKSAESAVVLRVALHEALQIPGAGTGGQLSFVGTDGDQVDIVDGYSDHAAMQVSTLHNTYCLTKPLLPIALALLVESGELDWSDEIHHILGIHPALPPYALTLRQVLSHDAGLGQLTAAHWRMTPNSERRRMMMSMITEDNQASYSELCGWILLESVISTLTCRSAAEFVTSEVLRPLGLDKEILIEVSAPIMGRDVGVPVGGLPDAPTALLGEMTWLQQREIRPAFGGLTTAAAMCRLFSALQRVHGGEALRGLPQPTTLHTMLSMNRGLRADPRLRRECDFAGGFMTRLDATPFGASLSPYAFGHTSGMGIGIALCDPDIGMCMAAYINGLCLDASNSNAARKRLIVAMSSLAT